MRSFLLLAGCLTVIALGKWVDHEDGVEKGITVHQSTSRRGGLEQFNGRNVIRRWGGAPMKRLLAVLLLGLSTNAADGFVMNAPLNRLRNHSSIQHIGSHRPVMLEKPAESANSTPDESSGINDALQRLPFTEVEYRVDKTDPDGWEYTKEEFIAYHGEQKGTMLWDAAAPPTAELPAASGRFGLSRRGALQGSLAVALAGVLADGAKLVEGVAGAAGKLSRAGIMLRVSQVAEFDEAFLRRAAGLTEKQAAKEGLNLFSWQQMSSSVANLLEITELEQLPGCAKAAEKLRDIKRVADMRKGILSAAEFQSIADKYALARKELEVAFKALPSELRAAGQLEMQELLAAEEEILVAEEARLLELEGAAVAPSTVATLGGIAAAAPEAAAVILDAVEFTEFQETILRQAAELSEDQLASAMSITRQQIVESADIFLVQLERLESLPGIRSAVKALKEVKQIAGKGSGPFTKSELSTMADKYARARKDLSLTRVPTELQRIERLALERAKEFRDAAEKGLKKFGGGR